MIRKRSIANRVLLIACGILIVGSQVGPAFRICRAVSAGGRAAVLSSTFDVQPYGLPSDPYLRWMVTFLALGSALLGPAVIAIGVLSKNPSDARKE